jgi:hypothetical protein
LLLSCTARQTDKIESKNETTSDTAYIIIDTIIVNARDTGFDYHLVFASDNKTYEIYRMTDKFNTGEFGYDHTHSDTKNSFIEFYESNIVDGSSMEIIYNRRNQSFYETDWFDSGGGEILLDGSVNFEKMIARKVITSPPNCGDYNEIKLTKIWEPTDEFKNKTLMKKQ